MIQSSINANKSCTPLTRSARRPLVFPTVLPNYPLQNARKIMGVTGHNS